MTTVMKEKGRVNFPVMRFKEGFPEEVACELKLAVEGVKKAKGARTEEKKRKSVTRKCVADRKKSMNKCPLAEKLKLF